MANFTPDMYVSLAYRAHKATFKKVKDSSDMTLQLKM